MRISTFFFSALAGVSTVHGASMYINGYSVGATDGNGNAIVFSLDPTSNATWVPDSVSGNSFRLPGNLGWTESSVSVSADQRAVLGLGPSSAFMKANQVVTINPKKGKMIVGPFDATPECREGRMSFAPQRGDAWRLPVQWQAGVLSVPLEFELGYLSDVFVIPRWLNHPVYLQLANANYRYYFDLHSQYTVAQAVTEFPTIHLLMDGFDLPLGPGEYLFETGNPVFNVDKIFNWSLNSRDTLPRALLNRIVVQLDLTHNRIGVCTPK